MRVWGHVGESGSGIGETIPVPAPSHCHVYLPTTSIDNQLIISPLAIVSTRKESTFPNSKLQVLVQWDGLSLDDTTWED